MSSWLLSVVLQWRSGVSGSIWRSRVLSHIPSFPLWEKSQAKKFVLALSCAALGYKWHACQFVFFCPNGMLESLRGLLDFHKGSLSSRGFHIALERLELVHRPLQGSQLGPRSMPTGWARLLPILFAYGIGSHSSHKETLFMDGCQIFEWGGYKWGTSYLAILQTSLLSCFLKQPVTLLGFLVIGWYLFQFSWPQISMVFVFMLLLITLLLWNNFRFSVKLQRVQTLYTPHPAFPNTNILYYHDTLLKLRTVIGQYYY